MLHHIEPKYSLNCCIYLIWFEFETLFEFELKTLEKINRKAIRKSLEKGKPISAQVGPLSLTPRARSCLRAFSPPLSRCPVGQACQRRPLACALASLSISPTPPVSSSSTPRPRSPAVDAPMSVRSLTTSAHPRPFEPRALLAHLPSLICALYQALSPSLSLCYRSPSTAACSAATVASAPHPVPR
jgi:hypothetical protein